MLKWLSGEGEGANQSMVRDWLRDRNAFNTIMNRLASVAYYENFLSNFPSENRYAASHESSALGVILSPANVPTHAKRPIAEVIGDVVIKELSLQHGKLPLAKLDFLFIQALREKPDFKDSLAKLEEIWHTQCSIYVIAEIIERHLKVIYEEACSQNIVTEKTPSKAKMVISTGGAALSGAITGATAGALITAPTINPVLMVMGGIIGGMIGSTYVVYDFVSHQNNEIREFHEFKSRIIKEVQGKPIQYP